MGWSIEVSSNFRNIKIEERICSVSNCQGNFYVAVMDMKGKQLREMEQTEAANALGDLIEELDRGNEGQFNDQYFVEADKKWSEGKETEQAWSAIWPFRDKIPYAKSYETYTGHMGRVGIREDAQRFLLYYLAGCKVSFEW